MPSWSKHAVADFIRRTPTNNRVEAKNILRTAGRFKSLMGLLYALMFITAGILTAVFLIDAYANSVMEQSISLRMESNEIYPTIAKLDETLTMSARMAAATGDGRWEERYLHFVPILDQAIKIAIRLHPQQYRLAGAQQIDDANQKLVAIELSSLKLAKEKRLKEAAALLDSHEYLNHKQIYSNGMEKFISSILTAEKESRESASRIAYIQRILPIPSILLFVISALVMQQGKKLLDQQLSFGNTLRNFNAQLQSMVEERTLSLHEAKQEAERANAQKSDFLANVTHELKTPVHCIMNYAQLGISSCQQNSPALMQEYFDDIFANSKRLDFLITDLLSFSKIEGGGLDFYLDMHSIKTLVENSAASVEPLMAEKRLTLALEGDWTESVIVDANRMMQILVNLMSNAIRFSPEGGKITWRCQTTEMPVYDSHLTAPALVLSITDKGPGIPPKELEIIFDHFIQGQSGIAKTGGTGLGLSICRSLLKTFHGTIQARNAPHGGAVFEIVLPMWHKTRSTLHKEKKDV